MEDLNINCYFQNDFFENLEGELKITNYRLIFVPLKETMNKYEFLLNKEEYFYFPLTSISKAKKNSVKSGNIIQTIEITTKNGRKFKLKFPKKDTYSKSFFEDIILSLTKYLKSESIKSLFAFYYGEKAYKIEENYKGLF